MKQAITFPSGTVDYLFRISFEELWNTYDQLHGAVIITNEHIAKLYAHLFKGHKTIVLSAMESSKDLHTIGGMARQLLEMEATRKTMLIGVGGGVITDITGFLASVYMRGVPFGFVPTTLLGMVDAAVGGKNGVNVGMNKNILGTITQPKFILYDTRFLDTLPDDEWSNGFAEIIKCACVFDADLYNELSKNSISYYKDKNDEVLDALIARCVNLKNKTVIEDEKETGARKLLNFGHTTAHAIENLYEISHGMAVGIGILIASMISTQVTGLDKGVTEELKKLLTKYHLPVRINIDTKKVMEILRMDKKRTGDTIDYILLEKIGKGVVCPLPFAVIEQTLVSYASDN
ncbi:MAG: 3-dehydroquinate synthase [Chitinophagales bacterium]